MPASAVMPIDDTSDRAVIGIDFSPASLGAARWVAAHYPDEPVAPGAAGMSGSTRRVLDARLVHVMPWPVGPEWLGSPPGGAPPPRDVPPTLLGGLAGVAASLRLGGARPIVRVGSPSAWLTEVAVAEGARLIVLGRRRVAGRQRLGEPNVIQRVARRAACDVLVVPEGAVAPVAHVIAAVDVSPFAERVVARSVALARAHGAALTLVHVLAPAQGSYDRLTRRRPTRPDDGAERHRAHEAAHRDAAYAWLAWLARDASATLPCELAVASGDAAREITALAARRGPSVVVVGKRGADETPLGSLGSVAREIVTRCPVPSLAVECGDVDGWRAE